MFEHEAGSLEVELKMRFLSLGFSWDRELTGSSKTHSPSLASFKPQGDWEVSPFPPSKQSGRDGQEDFVPASLG